MHCLSFSKSDQSKIRQHKMYKLITFLFLLFGTFTSFAQVKVSATLDNSKILIGDQIQLHLEATYPSNSKIINVDLTVLDSIRSEIDPSKQDQDPGTLEILDQTEWETLVNGNTTTYRKDINLTCWKEGVYFIPPIEFVFESGSNSRSNKLTLLVSSPIQQSEIPDTIQIAPIKEIIEEDWQFSDFLPIVYGIIGLLALVVGIVFLARYLSNKKKAPVIEEEVKRPAHEIALEKLSALKNQELWQKGDIKAYQSELTYITREYVENRYAIPALESTTGEILRDLKTVNFPDALVQKMREMLQLADMVKFAKAKPPEEKHTQLMGYAEEIIETTKEIIIEE